MEKIKQAILAIQAGQIIIITDDKNRENEGDLVLAAEFATPENMNFMIKNTGGVVCLSMFSEDTERLNLNMMTDKNRSKYATPFTISIDAREGVSTGISAHDRALTIRLASSNNASASDFVSPGHVFPLQAKPFGILQREGHTEASLDVVKLAGLKPMAVLSELMNADGSMMKGIEIENFASQYNILVISVEEIKLYRLKTENILREISSAYLPTEYGKFQMSILHNPARDEEYLVLKSLQSWGQSPLVRIHSQCITGDVFTSQRCDCGWQLQEAMKRIAYEGGVLIYLSQEGRGIGLANKIRAYALQEKGYDTVSANEELGFSADQRNYDFCGQILKFFGLNKVRLLTNNPKKIEALRLQGVDVEHESLLAKSNLNNHQYLLTKQKKLHHLFTLAREENVNA